MFLRRIRSWLELCGEVQNKKDLWITVFLFWCDLRLLNRIYIR